MAATPFVYGTGEWQDKLVRGWFYSGASFKQEWKASKNDTASLPTESVSMYLRKGEENCISNSATWKENGIYQ